MPLILYSVESMPLVVSMAATRLSVTVPEELMKEIEDRRGDVSRSRFVTSLLREKLGDQ